MTFALAGCSSKSDLADIGPDDNAADLGEPLPPPKASIAITYKKPGDSLERATVTKFFGAEVLTNAQTRSGRSATTVRFDGGVPIWEIRADRSLSSRIVGLGSASWALKQVEYGTVPAHFSQQLPDEGPPEPLDRGSFYVFTIERASGSVSYEAVKVLADGNLQSYAAQPRAGSSYVLCCGISSDFSEPVILPDELSPDDLQNPGEPGQQNPDSSDSNN